MRRAESDKPRWFPVDGEAGIRTLEQQLLGLGGLLRTSSTGRPLGKVLDLGCAEGLIAREFRRAGATEVDAVTVALWQVRIARRVCAMPGLRFHPCNLDRAEQRLTLDAVLVPPYDLVLLLSIIHKMRDPGAFLAWALAQAGEDARVAVRLPNQVYRDRGAAQREHDIMWQMHANGWRLESLEATCLDEWLGIFTR